MEKTAYDYALNLLTARAYTTRDLRRKLTQKAFDRVAIDEAIDRLSANGLLNDEKYAEEFARQRLVVSGASKRRVEQLLARKGISREVAQSASQKVVDEEDVDTISAMEKIARKKLLSLGDLEPMIKRRRVFGVLARKGYEIDDINQVLSRILP
jgi:regulatory protein